MEAVQESRPPAAASRSPETVAWPSVPQHEPTLQSQSHSSDITLPDLKTVLSPDFERMSSPQTSNHPGSPTSVRSLPRIDPGYVTINGSQRGTTDVSMASPGETGSVMSTEDRATSVVSMDDPDVRIAAEALSGLGNPGLLRNSRGPNMHVSNGIRALDSREEPEPLLELIAQAHPWVGGTIKTSLAAYSTTKHYSPRFVRHGAGFVERTVGMPMANAVNSVGEITGVDKQFRRYLDARKPGDVEQGTVDKRVLENGDLARARQEEQLPAWSASRPPSYREEASPASLERRDMKLEVRPLHNRSWSSQLFVTTSGLSVALSNTSRSSLRFCLRLLQESAAHVQTLSQALSTILREYEAARAQHRQSDNAILEKGQQRPATPDQSENARKLAESIKKTCDEIWQRLRHVVTSVSNYAGGALPENAREFVRGQLMSLPQRWRIVSGQHYAESETSRNAHRMINFATEGLDMMTQVSGVVKATLDSAEQWLARVGRSDGDQEMTDAPTFPNEKS